jgi:hypothetical protein
MGDVYYMQYNIFIYKSYNVRTGSAPFLCLTEAFKSGVKQLEREAYHISVCDEVNNENSYTFTPHVYCQGVHRDSFTFSYKR